MNNHGKQINHGLILERSQDEDDSTVTVGGP